MTKKHYETIAAAFKSQLDALRAAATGAQDGNRAQQALLDGAATMAGKLARDLATEFERDNPRFDRARFLQACTVPSV